MTLKWWNENKLYMAPVASGILWITSVMCFVFGLSFKNPVGYTLGMWDVSVWVAFALSLANTIIQLIGNGQKFEEMDVVFKAGWVASYILGISSNVNALLQILGMNNVGLEWGVALSLGTMIEVLPEKLIVIWLKSPSGKQEQKPQNNQQHQQQKKHIPFPPQKSTYKAQHRPVHNNNQIPNFPWMNNGEPTYHPVGMNNRSMDREGEM